MVAIEQRHEEMRPGDTWGKAFWVEGAAGVRVLGLWQGWVWGWTVSLRFADANYI